MKKKGIIIFFTAALLLFTLPPVQAAPFYQGKTVKIIISTKPGGGYDFYGRLLAKFMQKNLPGSTFIVKNVPGAGDIIGVNEMYHSKPNGLTFAGFNRAIPIAQIVGIKGVKFDVGKMSWFGSAAVETYTLTVLPKFKNLEGVKNASKIRLGSSGLGTSSHLFAAVFKEMTGWQNISVSTGYMGAESELAMIRGELEGQFASWSSMEPFCKDGNGIPVMFVGKKQPAGYENVPMLEDVITDKKYEGVLELLTASNILGRPYAGPPDIPEDRLKVMTDAYAKALNDPDLLKYANKAGRPIDFTPPEEALKRVKKMFQIDPEQKQVLKEAFGIK